MEQKLSSEDTSKLDAALYKAQAEIRGAHKDSTNPHYKTKYADLASVWDAIREPLTKNGISVTQTFTHDAAGDVLYCVTRLACAGQWVASYYPVITQKKDPQGYGSAVTYARRYTLAAIAGVAPEDDDGEGSMGRGQTQKDDAPPPLKPVTAPPPKEMVKEMFLSIGDGAQKTRNYMLKKGFTEAEITILFSKWQGKPIEFAQEDLKKIEEDRSKK